MSGSSPAFGELANVGVGLAELVGIEVGLAELAKLISVCSGLIEIAGDKLSLDKLTGVCASLVELGGIGPSLTKLIVVRLGLSMSFVLVRYDCKVLDF